MKAIKRFFQLRKNEKGFTLIELMVVLAIIAILAGVFVIPGVLGAAERGRVAGANTDVNVLQQATELFVVDNEELPNRKDATTENYYTLLFTGMASDGTVLTAVKMENKQGSDNSTSGVLVVGSFPLANRDNLYNHMVVNNRYYPAFKEHGQSGQAYGWRESYLKLKGVMLDPWGNSYLVALRNLGNSTTRVYILSAAANKVIDTNPATDERISPDDIGMTWIMRP